MVTATSMVTHSGLGRCVARLWCALAVVLALSVGHIQQLGWCGSVHRLRRRHIRLGSWLDGVSVGVYDVYVTRTA